MRHFNADSPQGFHGAHRNVLQRRSFVHLRMNVYIYVPCSFLQCLPKLKPNTLFVAWKVNASFSLCFCYMFPMDWFCTRNPAFRAMSIRVKQKEFFIVTDDCFVSNALALLLILFLCRACLIIITSVWPFDVCSYARHLILSFVFEPALNCIWGWQPARQWHACWAVASSGMSFVTAPDPPTNRLLYWCLIKKKS